MESNIFHKIFEIMNCYENLLNNHSKCNNKNKSTDFSNNFMKNEDNFFTFIFKNIHIHKNNQENNNNAEITNKNDNVNNNINYNTNDKSNDNTNDNSKEYMNDNKNLNDIDIPIEKDEIIKSYIKKCYKRIVLKCHPDKNNNPDDNKYFIKCQEYYDNCFLIGLLYIFYLYKLEPPLLCDVVINRILCEIRIIQEKILLFQN